MHRFCFSALILVVISLLTVAARAEEGAPPDLLPTLASIERLDPRFDALVPKDAVIEVLAGGFVWAGGLRRRAGQQWPHARPAGLPDLLRARRPACEPAHAGRRQADGGRQLPRQAVQQPQRQAHGAGG